MPMQYVCMYVYVCLYMCIYIHVCVCVLLVISKKNNNYISLNNINLSVLVNETQPFHDVIKLTL